MTSLKTSAIVALMTAAVGLSAITPSYAQDATPPAPPAAAEQAAPSWGHGPLSGMRQHDGGRGGDRGMAGFIGFDGGAEAVEIALVRLSHAIDMTPEQKTLFDTLKTDALAAAETFSATLEGLRPAAPAEGTQPEPLDIAKGLDLRIALQTAQLEALKSVQPAVTAFFASLTDEQKAELAPVRAMRGDHKGPHEGRGGAPMGGPDVAAPAAPTNG